MPDMEVACAHIIINAEQKNISENIALRLIAAVRTEEPAIDTQ